MKVTKYVFGVIPIEFSSNIPSMKNFISVKKVFPLIQYFYKYEKSLRSESQNPIDNQGKWSPRIAAKMEVHYFLILFIRPEHVDEMISFKISSSDLSMLM